MDFCQFCTTPHSVVQCNIIFFGCWPVGRSVRCYFWFFISGTPYLYEKTYSKNNSFSKLCSKIDFYWSFFDILILVIFWAKLGDFAFFFSNLVYVFNHNLGSFILILKYLIYLKRGRSELYFTFFTFSFIICNSGLNYWLQLKNHQNRVILSRVYTFLNITKTCLCF